MGQITPDGVADREMNPQESNPAVDFDITPDPIMNEFFNSLNGAVQQDAAAEEAVDLLINEIQKTTGLFTDSPDMQAQASSRMEQLNTAIQDSNMPEDIKSSFNNIYTASIDNPQYLNALNGFILQGGGSISGIAGAAQRLNDEAIEKRNKENSSRAATATAAAIAQSAARVDAANENYSSAMDDWTKKLLAGEISYKQYREAADKDSEAALARALTKDEAEQIRDHQITDTERRGKQGELTSEQVENQKADINENFHQQMQKLGNGVDNNIHQSAVNHAQDLDFATSLMVKQGSGINLKNDGLDIPDFETKADMNAMIEQIFADADQKLEDQKRALQDTEQEYTQLKNDYESAMGQFQTFLGFNDEEQALITQMEQDIAEQKYTLALQEEVNTGTRAEIEKQMAKIEDPSDIDMNFIKQAFIDIDPELVAKTTELNQRLGVENHNPIVQMQAMLEDQGLELTDQQRADLTDFIDTVTDLKTDLSAAQQELERQGDIAYGVNEDGSSRQQDSNFPGMAGKVNPFVYVDHAQQDVTETQEKLNSYAQQQGVSLNSETQTEDAPAPAPEEPSAMDIRAAEIAQQLAAMDSVSRANLEEIVYNDNWMGPMHDQMIEKVEAQLTAQNPDFKFADMDIDDQIVLAFIQNDGTLTQQDIELIVSENGIEGPGFKTAVDELTEKYSQHPHYNIDPPVQSAAAEYQPVEADAPGAAQPAQQAPEHQAPAPDGQEDYAYNNDANRPLAPPV